MVSVKIAPKDAPHIGKGRWTWPVTAMNDWKLLADIEELGKKLQENIANLNGPRLTTHNPQTLWETFKQDITERAKTSSRTSHHKRASRIKTLNKERKELLSKPDFNDNEDMRWEEAILANRIDHLENLNSKNQRTKTRARIACHGEKMGGIWSNLSKSKKPRDIIA